MSDRPSPVDPPNFGALLAEFIQAVPDASRPRFLARLYLRLRGRDPSFLSTLHEMTPGRVRALVEAAGLEVMVDPTQRRLAAMEEVLDGRRRPRGTGSRLLAALARSPGGGRLLRALIRRGFLVDGALLARRPPTEARP